MESQAKKNFPKILNMGMRVTAMCMGREVGSYIVTGVSKNLVIMEVEHDPDERNVIAERAVGGLGYAVWCFERCADCRYRAEQ